MHVSCTWHMSIENILELSLITNCHINERETPKTCLTNHKGSISHHITPLVINSLGGGHSHTHTHKHTQITDKSNFKKPVTRRPKAGTCLV